MEFIDRGLALTETDSQATDLRLLLTNKASNMANLDRQAEAIATARLAPGAGGGRARAMP